MFLAMNKSYLSLSDTLSVLNSNIFTCETKIGNASKKERERERERENTKATVTGRNEEGQFSSSAGSLQHNWICLKHLQ